MKLSEIQKQLLVGFNGKLGKDFNPSVTITVHEDESVEAVFFFLPGNRTTRKYAKLERDPQNFDVPFEKIVGNIRVMSNYKLYECFYLTTEHKEEGVGVPYINLYYK